jgi:hypothetical protein
MTLAFILIDADPELSGHGERSLLRALLAVARRCITSRHSLPAFTHADQRDDASLPLRSYIILLR